jgi:putative ubiquitin-RnfH superfamily antitoxin RatB of RatAB toxin-antitoxin module
MPDGKISIEVAYASPEKQILFALLVDEGTTLGEGIELSSIRQKCPEIEIDPAAVGIFGRRETLNYSLKDGDRIEIYRALIADPKEVRRERARKG